MLNKILWKLKQIYVSFSAADTKRNPKLWIFGEWYGTKANDNSCFLANYIAEHYQKNLQLKLVWIANADANLHLLNKGIEVVQRDSDESKQLLLQAGVLIVNEEIMDINSSKMNYASGAVTVNLWHGVPWKRIFNDQYINEKKAFIKLRTGLNAWINNCTYWLSPSSDMKEILVRANFVKTDNVITAGYPRNIFFYDKDKLSQLRSQVLRQIGADFSAKIIAYMPTFRDAGDEVFSFDSLATDKDFVAWLKANNIYIIQKAHFVNQTKYNLSGINEDEHTRRIINDNDIAAFELMGASDMLVTDYSSCFFDYLILDRPIVHFIYDYDKYVNQDRGVYYTAEEVCCGDAVKNTTDLKKALADNIAHPDKDKQLREKRRKRFMNFESSHSCEGIYQFIKEKVENKYKVKLDGERDFK